MTSDTRSSRFSACNIEKLGLVHEANNKYLVRSTIPLGNPWPILFLVSPPPPSPVYFSSPHTAPYTCVQVLSHCERITDNGIRSLLNGACSETLQVLELDNCPFITDQSLELLRSVDYRSCDLFSLSCDQMICHMINCFVTWHTPHVCSCRGCQVLKRLEIFDCLMVSRSGISKLEVSK